MSGHATSTNARIGDVLTRIPPFPTALDAILDVCKAEDPSLSEIAHVVSMEEVLAAKVVRAANAEVLAPSRQVDNVADAVSRLGIPCIRGIASAYFLGNDFTETCVTLGLDREALWRHNLAAAAASAGAAGGGCERANAYFAGLMHDIGKMVLAAELGPVYLDCLQEAASSGTGLERVEQTQLGTDHAEVGADAAKQWNFAPEVVEAIRRHHQILGAGLLPPLASHVLVGNQVANDMGFTAYGQSRRSGPPPLGGMVVSIGTGIMSRARWALTNEMPKIEAMLPVMG